MYKVKALKTFQDRNKKMIPKGKTFKADDHYARLLINYKLVEVITIINEKPKGVIRIAKEKSKEVYKKKIIEPEKNKEEKVKEYEGYGKKLEEVKVEPREIGILEESTGKKERKKISPITTDQFKTKKRKSGIIKRSRW